MPNRLCHDFFHDLRLFFYCSRAIADLRDGKQILYHTDEPLRVFMNILHKLQAYLCPQLPAVSDPGEQLVADCAREGVRVVPLPGACAAVCALSGAGLPSRRFAFEGFLPDKKGERERYLAGLRGDTHTLVFYIAPHDAQRDLADLYRALGDRRAVLCRELTKRNEEILRLPLGELKDCPFTIRGEMALVVEGASPAESWESLSVEAHVALYVGQGMPEMDAIKAVAADRGLPKSEVYARVKIKKEE